MDYIMLTNKDNKGSAMKKKLILLCDYGLDDAVATIYLLNNREKFLGIDILAVGGNVPQNMSYNNLLKLLDAYKKENSTDLSDIRIIDCKNIKHAENYLPHIHGVDGMGDVLPDIKCPNVQAVDYYKWLDEVNPQNSIILSLGPCTVTADILKNKGQIELYLMAGNIAEPPNYNGYEFNHGMDRSAFSYCVGHLHKIATLDSCHIPQFDMEINRPICSGLMDKLIEASIILNRKNNLKECYVYDFVAAHALVNPDKYITIESKDKDNNTLSVLKLITN